MANFPLPSPSVLLFLVVLQSVSRLFSPQLPLLLQKEGKFLMYVWMTKISGNKQKLKPFLKNGRLGRIKQVAFVITFCSENLPLLMIITGGKFSSCFAVGSSCSGGDSVFISSVFTNTSSVRKKTNFYCTCG